MFRGGLRWASTHRVYTHGIGVPLRMEGYTLCYHIYIPVWRRHLLLLFLDIEGFPRTVKDEEFRSNQIPAPSFLIDIGSLLEQCSVVFANIRINE